MSAPARLTCQEAFERLEDFVDRELNPEELQQVEAHLETCAGCAPHFQVEAEVLDGIRRRVRRIQAPAGLLDRILSRLRAG